MVDPAPRSQPRLDDIEAAIRLFDETTGALSARVRRLEEVLVQKQQELVTANRALEAKVNELDRLMAWLELVMGAVASGVVAVDAAGRITTCNAAARAALVPLCPDPIGRDHHALLPEAGLGRVLAGAATSAAYEHVIRLADGGRRVLAAQASPLLGPSGAIIGAVEVFEDVTEVRRLRDQVERADRLKQLGEMAAGVAHEIRNPLNGIEGFASLLMRDLPAEDKRHRFATHIVEGVRDLNRTVSALLAFTNPRRIERRRVDPVALATDCLALVRSELDLHPDDHRPVHLELDDQWRRGGVEIDGMQLKQVLLNLVQNAVHAVCEGGPEAGRVRVAVASVDGALVLSVDDDGPGVPVAARQRIFTPFFTTRDHGTGLGLAVAHTIVTLHGGTLTVEDAPLGGARFRVVVPL
jgi:signal transduction histidine kinase